MGMKFAARPAVNPFANRWENQAPIGDIGNGTCIRSWLKVNIASSGDGHSIGKFSGMGKGFGAGIAAGWVKSASPFASVPLHKKREQARVRAGWSVVTITLRWPSVNTERLL
jgi:hypothetical protein